MKNQFIDDNLFINVASIPYIRNLSIFWKRGATLPFGAIFWVIGFALCYCVLKLLSNQEWMESSSKPINTPHLNLMNPEYEPTVRNASYLTAVAFISLYVI
jgi:hypothetical protein